MQVAADSLHRIDASSVCPFNANVILLNNLLSGTFFRKSVAPTQMYLSSNLAFVWRLSPCAGIGFLVSAWLSFFVLPFMLTIRLQN